MYENIIAIPFRERDKHLEYFIPSALSQTYRNYKIVVVDNGSTDNSVSLILA